MHNIRWNDENATRLCVGGIVFNMNIFRFDALLAVDKEKYSSFVLQEIDRIYGKMLQEGATSFWETEKGAADFDGAGSLCHGWSAIPIYYYHVLKIVKN